MAISALAGKAFFRPVTAELDDSKRLPFCQQLGADQMTHLHIFFSGPCKDVTRTIAQGGPSAPQGASQTNIMSKVDVHIPREGIEEKSLGKTLSALSRDVES